MRRPLLILLSASAWISCPAADLGRPDLDDPEFAKRFSASYGFLSSREPQVTAIESTLLEKLAPLVAEQPDQARAMIEDILTNSRGVSAAFNQILGNIFATTEDWAPAEAQYREAIRKFPDFQRAWNSLGSLKMQQGDYPAAAQALGRSVELGAADTQTYGMLGYALLQQRDYVGAEVAYNLALVRDADNLRWLEGKARILAESGRHAETIAAVDELLRQQPDNVEYWRLRANAALGLGRDTEAARDLEIARQLGPLDANALYLLGNLYLRQDLPEHALDALLAAIRVLPDPEPSILLRVAHSLLNQQQPALARRLMDLMPAAGESWARGDRVRHALLQGRIALEEKKSDAAIAAFTTALDLDPLHAECLYRLAVVEAEQGRPDRARLHLERIKGDLNYEYGAQLFLAKLLVLEHRYAAALPYLRAALRLRPTMEIENLYHRVRVAAESAP
jgi:tetratricopeptide (TPR) repeat protein